MGAAASAAVAVGDVEALPKEDQGFVDTTNGWGWSDKCWGSIQQNRLAAARAQCAEGLKVAPSEGGPRAARPSLLNNLGIIEERDGDLAGARDYFQQSLALRSHPDVVASLKRVGGTPSTSAAPDCLPCSSQEDFDRVTKKGSKCCPVVGCKGDTDCHNGRVCCEIPDGQLCSDVARCSNVNRVSMKTDQARAKLEQRCASTCPGVPVQITHCYCVCMGDCTGP